MAKKPTGGAAFDALARKLIQVPKKELDAAVRRYRKQKRKRK
jgi:hypothetical protein